MKYSNPIYPLNEMPEFLKSWVQKGAKDNSQLELYIPLPIAEDIAIGFITMVVGFLFGMGMGLGGIAGILNQFSWGMVFLAATGLIFIGIFFLGLRMFIRSIRIWLLKRDNMVGIWILKTGILIRDEPDQVEYYKWEQLENAEIENGFVTQNNSPSKHYSLKMLRFDFKINENYRFRFKGLRGSRITQPTNELIDLLAYDVSQVKGSLERVIKACEKFISIKQ